MGIYTRRGPVAAAVAMLIIAGACGSGGGSASRKPSPNAVPNDAGGVSTGSGSQPYIDAIRDTLRSTSPGTEGKVWWLRNGNNLPDGWLLQTPNCWGTTRDCGQPPPGGRAFLDRMQSMIRGAKKSVDIADLYQFEVGNNGFNDAGPFLDALINGLRDGHRDHPKDVPLVRILIGVHPPGFMSTTLVVNRLKDRVGDWVRVQSGAMNTLQTFSQPKGVPISWNHEKVIDVDGTLAIVGGMNYWPSDYLNTNHPTNDLSMVVRGEAAGDVSRFTDVLWSWVCDHQTFGFGLGIGVTWTPGSAVCQKETPKDAAPAHDGVPVLIVGHLGQGIDVPGQGGKQSTPFDRPPAHGNACEPPSNSDNGYGSEVNLDRGYEYRNPGEIALRTLIGQAKKSIFISQQDLLSCLPDKKVATEAKFDERAFSALAAKIKEGVPIKIVVSNTGGGYSNGWTTRDVAETLRGVVATQYNLNSDQSRDLVCHDVGLTSVRNGSSADKWADGKNFYNHAKLVAVDDQAFYIGSENLYPARLQELGLIVDNAQAGAQLKSAYLDPLWTNSRAGALIDPERGICGGFL